jgi:MYXO-CTERM domain-containing protein
MIDRTYGASRGALLHLRASGLGLLVAAIAYLASGCVAAQQHTASLQDSFTGDVLAPLLGNPNGLSSPYAQGSKFTITVVAGNGADPSGWTLTSSNPGVMAIGTHDREQWPVTAASAGQSTLSVVDEKGETVDTATIEVDVVTDVRLYAQGLLLAGRSDQESRVDSVQMVSGGTATFLVRYFSGAQELAAINGLVPTPSGAASAKIVGTNLSVRDFLEVTAPTAGTGSIDLTVGTLHSEVAVAAVDPLSISSITLAPQSESGATKGQMLYVFGRALDSHGADIFGASFSWQVGGTQVSPEPFYRSGPIDLLTYEYDGSQTETVNALASGFSAAVNVHGSPATTTEHTTANLGCSMAPGKSGPVGLGSTGVLGLAALLVARRRRAA